MFNILQAKKTDDLKVFWCNGLQEKRNTEYSRLRLAYYLSTRSSVEEITVMCISVYNSGAQETSKTQRHSYLEAKLQPFNGKQDSEVNAFHSVGWTFTLWIQSDHMTIKPSFIDTYFTFQQLLRIATHLHLVIFALGSLPVFNIFFSFFCFVLSS